MMTYKVLALTLLATCTILLAIPPAHAATILVDLDPITGAGVVEVDTDDGLCSLKEAIVNANNGAPTHADCIGGTAGANTILLPANAVFTISTASVLDDANGNTGLPLITSNLTIKGNDSIIERDESLPCVIGDGILREGEFRLFLVPSGFGSNKLTIENATLRQGCPDGNPPVGSNGGAILTQRDLVLRGVTVTANRTRNGGGVFASGGNLLVENSLFSSNQAASFGGAIDSTVNTTLRNSTFVSNNAVRGGAIALFGSSLGHALEHVTFSNNVASQMGGGLYSSNTTIRARNVILENSTCAEFNAGNPVWEASSLNFDSGTSCAMRFDSNFTGNATLDLLPLDDNGGPTQTLALGATSPALDAATDCTTFDGMENTTDQRGVARPQGTACDVGAFEAHTVPTEPQTIFVDDVDGMGVVLVASDGLCSLIEAIENANTTSETFFHPDCNPGFPDGADTIVLPTGAVFTLTEPASFGNFGVSGLPEITSEITIAGNGATIQRDPTLICNLDGTLDIGEFRLLLIQPSGNLIAEDLTLANGCADGQGNQRFGGGIYNELGTLTLRRSTVRHNSARVGGGGLYDATPLQEAETLVESSTFLGNLASSGGGLLASGNLTVRNSTLSGNSADLRGGGIVIQGSASDGNVLTLEQVSLFNNTAPDGGGIYAIRSTTNARNVILQGSDCGSQSSSPPPTWNAAGANLDSGTSCADVFGSNFTASAVTNLDSLADNGGPTQTHALLPGSEAVDAVPAGDCTSFDGNTDITTDQRGIARPQGSACDIGAYELVNAMPIADAGADQTTTAGNLVTLDGSGSFDPDGHVPLTYAWLQIDGDSVSLSNAGAAMPTFSAPFVDGNLVFELIVTDSFGLASEPNTVAVTVELPQYEVTAATGAGQGNITPASQTVVWDETATFTVIPDAGWSTAALDADSCTPTLIADDQWQAANIQADCAVQATFEVNQYIIGGTVLGLEGSGLTLELNGSELLPISTSGSFQFSTEPDHESDYVVVIDNQPSGPSQTCTIDNGSGTVTAQNVDNIAVICTTNTFTIGGTLSGLAAGSAVALQNNDDDDLMLNDNGGFTFATPLDDLSDYAVTVLDQPRGQFCSVASSSGTLDGNYLDNVSVDCVGIQMGLSLNDIEFGELLPGASTQQTLTLTNTGQPDLVIEAFTVPSQPFGFEPHDCAPLPLVLAPGESCTVMMSFSSETTGDFADGLLVVSNAGSSPDRAGLTGSVVLPAIPVPSLGLPALLLLLMGMLAIVGTRLQLLAQASRN